MMNSNFKALSKASQVKSSSLLFRRYSRRQIGANRLFLAIGKKQQQKKLEEESFTFLKNIITREISATESLRVPEKSFGRTKPPTLEQCKTAKQRVRES